MSVSRTCLDCPEDISDRHHRALRCPRCAAARNARLAAGRAKEAYRRKSTAAGTRRKPLTPAQRRERQKDSRRRSYAKLKNTPGYREGSNARRKAWLDRNPGKRQQYVDQQRARRAAARTAAGADMGE